MNRIAISLSLLALFLFNAFGYYVLFAYEQHQVHSLVFSQLSDSDFTITKIPATLYTHVEDSDFEYVNTQINVAGKEYMVVKQRILHDTLFIYSLRNFKAENLTEKLNDFVVSQTIEKQTGTHSTSPIKNLLKSFIKVYLSNNGEIFCLFNSYPKSIQQKIISDADILISAEVSIFSPPPKFV